MVPIKNYIFPINVAISRVLSVYKVLDKENIENLVPAKKEVEQNLDGHKIL